MGAEDKLKTAAIAAGTALATAAAFLGFKSHQEKEDGERARLQAEYMASREQNMAHLEAKHAEVQQVCQELGQFNPQSNFAKRLRPNKPSFVETQNAQEQEQQMLLNQPDVS